MPKHPCISASSDLPVSMCAKRLPYRCIESRIEGTKSLAGVQGARPHLDARAGQGAAMVPTRGKAARSAAHTMPIVVMRYNGSAACDRRTTDQGNEFLSHGHECSRPIRYVVFIS